MEKAKKIYAGSGKKQSETWLKVNLNLDELNKHAQEYMGKNYVKVNVNITDADKFGKTVQVTIDTWKPDTANQTTAPARQAQTAKPSPQKEYTDLPF